MKEKILYDQNASLILLKSMVLSYPYFIDKIFSTVTTKLIFSEKHIEIDIKRGTWLLFIEQFVIYMVFLLRFLIHKHDILIFNIARILYLQCYYLLQVIPFYSYQISIYQNIGIKLKQWFSMFNLQHP